MTDELDPRLLDAIRAEAYRLPVTITGDELRRRLERDGRRGRSSWGWLGAAGIAAALVAVIALSTLPSQRPPISGSSPTPGAECDESPPTAYGWWVEVGGPNAFFNVEPGTLTATDRASTWLVHARFDPDAGAGQTVSIAADQPATRLHVDGRLNARTDPASIFHFESPAPNLPGGWYLFEIDIDAPGCWDLSARTDDQVVGSATVLVAPATSAPTDPIATAPPTPATPGPTDSPPASPSTGQPVAFDLVGTAVLCEFFGGCGWFVEVVGEGRRDRVELVVTEPPGAGQGGPGTTYNLELGTPIDPLLPGRTYAINLESRGYSDDRPLVGEQAEGTRIATCSTAFQVPPGPSGIIVEASFEPSSCSIETRYVLLVGQPPYELDCGPLAADRCRELADRAVESALSEYPDANVVRIAFSSVVGDYRLDLDNGKSMIMIVD